MIPDGELVTVGLNHRTAPVGLRERLAMGRDLLPGCLARLRESGAAREAMILSTCNRVEVYALVDQGDAGDRVVAHLARERDLPRRELDRHLLRLDGMEAVTHVFRVASSLDSMVVGEPQILHQLKDAFQVALACRSVGQVLQRMVRRAVSVAKLVRTQTGIARAHVSVGSAGVELAGQVFGRLEGRSALLVGAGQMGRLIARALLAGGVQDLVVANRTWERAVELAELYGGAPARLDELDRHLGSVDIVIVSTSSTEHILSRSRMAPIMRARRYRPLLCVDLSVPRNIAPDVNELEGAFVFNVDDLTEVAARGREQRLSEARRAERIVSTEAERFYEALGAWSASPAIARVTRHAEQIRRLELERSRALLDALEPGQREVLDAMTRAMFKRFLHLPIRRARLLGEAGDLQGLQALVQALVPPEEDGT